MPFSRFPFFYQSNYYNRYPVYNKPFPNNTPYEQKKIENSPSNNNHKSNYTTNNSSQDFNLTKNHIIEDNFDKKNNSKSSTDSDSYFFELFGLKLYFDDVLIICLIFFLYEEGIKDDELFMSLILLLLS